MRLAFGLVALNQPERQTKPLAQDLFTTAHLSGVEFVVVAGEMDKAVEHKDLKLCFKGVAARSALAAGGFDADGDVPLRGFCALE